MATPGARLRIASPTRFDREWSSFGAKSTLVSTTTTKLVEEEISLSRETVRRILRANGTAPVRKRRAPKHRTRRERMRRAGELVQWDGSTHDWLEGRGPRLCLMGAVDDATGELLPGAHFTASEGSGGYLRLLRDIPRKRGNFAGKSLIVRHLLDGRIHVFDHDGNCIAWAEGPRPTNPSSGPRTVGAYKTKQRRIREKAERQRLENDDWG